MNHPVIVALAALVGLGMVLWVAPPFSAFEWAAWVQATGVLMALMWGAQLQREAALRSGRQAGHIAALFASNMHWVFRELADACAHRNPADFTVHRRILEEILAQGREASLQQLDGRGLAMVTSLRTLAVEALEVMVASPHEEDRDWAALQEHFARRLPSIAAWLSAAGHPPEHSGPTDYHGLRTSMDQLERR
ncbi:hypothetical protein PGB34_05690 [Xenophilus arseniciresistens]|uniref:Uncharacterized protein n=1 Tax=Xenophilus arseniciresistens TaxID=1283306 RepID=A0AAE3SZG7_9BURK|nr:hypothetical protein [Xenophilus arseniciresistens]MDA7415851.1 hypothetical protein [Xenophilus arseniciresistens]